MSHFKLHKKQKEAMTECRNYQCIFHIYINCCKKLWQYKLRGFLLFGNIFLSCEHCFSLAPGKTYLPKLNNSDSSLITFSPKLNFLAATLWFVLGQSVTVLLTVQVHVEGVTQWCAVDVSPNQAGTWPATESEKCTELRYRGSYWYGYSVLPQMFR